MDILNSISQENKLRGWKVTVFDRAGADFPIAHSEDAQTQDELLFCGFFTWPVHWHAPSQMTCIQLSSFSLPF